MKTMIIAAALAAALATPVLAQSGMTGMDHSAHMAAPAQTAEGFGVVTAVDAKAGVVTLKHDPIAALKWPAMTMPFKAAPDLLAPLKVGQAVRFTVQPVKGGGEILAIAPR